MSSSNLDNIVAEFLHSASSMSAIESMYRVFLENVAWHNMKFSLIFKLFSIVEFCLPVKMRINPENFMYWNILKTSLVNLLL